MNIALVIWQLDTYGGSIRQVLEEARYLKKLGHEVDLFAYHVDKERCFPEFIHEIDTYAPEPIPAKQQFYNQSDSIFRRMWAFVYNEYVQYQQVQAIGKQIQARHAAHPYAVINYHDHGVYRLAPQFPEVKNVWMMNDPPSFIDAKEKDASLYAQTLLMRLLAWVEMQRTRRALRAVHEIVVLDARNQDIVKRYFDRSARIVRSGLSIAKKLQTYTPKKKKKVLSILTTNIFFRHRRYEDLIEAANILINTKKIKQISFRIVGDPAPDMGYFSLIADMVKKYKLTKYVQFLGKVSEQQLEKEYQGADIFVFPNHNQTWGLSVFEAMLRGAAVLVSKTAGAHDVLSDGKNALLFEPKNPSDMAQKLQRVIEDQTLRARLSKNGHAFVLKNISWEKYAKDMAKVFSE